MYRKSGSKAVKTASLRALIDTGVHLTTGRVALHLGEPLHYEVNGDDNLEVSLVLDDGQEIWALWAPLVGGNNWGVFLIPPVGTEVAVGFPHGEYEGDPIILGALSSPTPDDLQPGRVLVIGTEVWVYDGDGTPQPLATKADVDALAGYIEGHTHPAPGGTTSPPTGPVPEADGTEVLKAL